MVIVAGIYLWFYTEVGVGTFLPTPIPPNIPSDSDSTALVPSTVKGAGEDRAKNESDFV
jgi:hypothetical protein